MPSLFGDGRLDSILLAFHRITKSERRSEGFSLDWQRTKEFTPAGYAILAALIDSATEHQKEIRSIHASRWLSRLSLFQLLSQPKMGRLLLPAEKLTLHQPALLSARDGAIDPLFTERMKELYGNQLGDDLLFHAQTILNELMQNAVDHAGAERYYLYAGVSENEFHLGVLDMGHSIPAKLERKYSSSDDRGFLELAFKKGVGTRRTREGGVGLWYVYDIVKRNQGRLVLISRGAQFRKYFQTRRSQINGLKHTLPGTWCMIRLPAGRNG